MKKKKIFKALGVGVLATLGLFTFTGCSLSDNEKEDLMKGIENANDYMEEQIDLLKNQNNLLAQQNRELKEENDILQDYLEELQKENAKITSKEALNKLALAVNMFITNNNGIRDNLKIICEEDRDNEKLVYTKSYYESENNGCIYMGTESYEDVNVGIIVYEHDGKIYGYEKDLKNPEDYKKGIFGRYSSSEAYADIYNFADNIMFEKNTTANDIKSVEILQNGNYKIAVILNDEGRESETDFSNTYYTLEYEITKDCRFVQCVVNMFCQKNIKEPNTNVKYEVRNTTMTITFEYDSLTEEYVNGLLQEAISKPLTSQD